jgi:hypothetical protein
MFLSLFGRGADEDAMEWCQNGGSSTDACGKNKE